MKVNSLKSGVAKINYYGTKTLDNLLLYGGKLAGRMLFPIMLIRNPKLYINHPTYFPDCKLKSKAQILVDQLLYILRTGEINTNYFVFGFDRKAKNDFKNYVPWLTFTHARNIKNQRPAKPVYDPYNFICLLRDKFVFEAFCKGIGINTPESIGMINSGELYLLKERRFTTLDNIVEFELDTFCKKNVSYGGGLPHNVLKLQINKGKILVNNESVDLERFKKLIGNDIWIIQERIKNQNYLCASFHPHSINTIRIVTVNAGSSINVLCAVFRMGVNGRITDNWSSGGIKIRVNVKNGTLQKWGLYKPGFGTKSDRHPNSGIIFDGIKLPFWKETIKYVKNVHRLFYGLHSVGWDVCLTSDGPLLIEGNDNWDTNIAQGARNEFEKHFR